jgi:hypothetical protein
MRPIAAGLWSRELTWALVGPVKTAPPGRGARSGVPSEVALTAVLTRRRSTDARRTTRA